MTRRYSEKATMKKTIKARQCVEERTHVPGGLEQFDTPSTPKKGPQVPPGSRNSGTCMNWVVPNQFFLQQVGVHILIL